MGGGGSGANGKAPTAPTAPTANKHTLKQRPSAATPVMKPTPGKKPTPVKKRPSGKADGDDDDAEVASPDKLFLATQLANGDGQLAARAPNLSQTDKNRWKDKIENAETCQELKREWAALGELGHGRNKKMNLGSTSLILCYI